MEVWQIVSPVRILRFTRQNRVGPHFIPVPYFPPPFKKDGPEELYNATVFFAMREQPETIHGITLATIDETILQISFLTRLVSYIVLVEKHTPNRDPEAGLQVIHRRMQVVSFGTEERPGHELGCTLWAISGTAFQATIRDSLTDLVARRSSVQ